MGFEALEKEIKSRAEDEAAKILARTGSEVKKLIAEAEKKRGRLLSEAKLAGQRAAKASERMELSAASIKARRIVMDAREQVVQKALGHVYAKLLAYRKTPGYGKLFKQILAEGAKRAGKNPVIYARKEDLKLCGRRKVRLIDCDGGAVIESADGGIRVDYTFESVFRDKKDEIRKNLYEGIFTQ